MKSVTASVYKSRTGGTFPDRVSCLARFHSLAPPPHTHTLMSLYHIPWRPTCSIPSGQFQRPLPPTPPRHLAHYKLPRCINTLPGGKRHLLGCWNWTLPAPSQNPASPNTPPRLSCWLPGTTHCGCTLNSYSGKSNMLQLQLHKLYLALKVILNVSKVQSKVQTNLFMYFHLRTDKFTQIVSPNANICVVLE